ncbi:hypothetical protein PBT90_06760 [Algoriphagus halophytocola]|uniref:Uncharacterized protein n=1 Tax=Algoriphagus halophytocola TaxID=2991499 RepID=A0ABY6MH38_9BACT|nr:MULTISPECIES: hypothetical protein [unclassified Algoriphagus]UZD23093.1 hypothetical protein OM944_01080 [Algoriphagus sp. TR-M5]WBL44385.1 hypothetical protein PBT90_06760 [Algoriphagus sp. TR-M9]
MGKTKYIDYYKTILEKVSFDKHLLMKEYSKALQVLQDHEKRELNNWLVSQGIIQKPILFTSGLKNKTTAKPSSMISISKTSKTSSARA